jgi:hypothetical protein
MYIKFCTNFSSYTSFLKISTNFNSNLIVKGLHYADMNCNKIHSREDPNITITEC